MKAKVRGPCYSGWQGFEAELDEAAANELHKRVLGLTSYPAPSVPSQDLGGYMFELGEEFRVFGYACNGRVELRLEDEFEPRVYHDVPGVCGFIGYVMQAFTPDEPDDG